jgi:hypothetical protein
MVIELRRVGPQIAEFLFAPDTDKYHLCARDAAPMTLHECGAARQRWNNSLHTCPAPSGQQPVLTNGTKMPFYQDLAAKSIAFLYRYRLSIW